MRDDFPAVRYVLVGEGHDESRLRALAQELGVADRVIFAGSPSDDELPEAYATSTVYVGPSRIDNEINVEGFGLSFLEAAASELPVVAGAVETHYNWDRVACDTRDFTLGVVGDRKKNR